jgi:hypothetical protein
MEDYYMKVVSWILLPYDMLHLQAFMKVSIPSNAGKIYE